MANYVNVRDITPGKVPELLIRNAGAVSDIPDSYPAGTIAYTADMAYMFRKGLDGDWVSMALGSSGGSGLTAEQLEKLENALTLDDLGEGLQLDEDGHLVTTNATVKIRIGDTEISPESGVIEVPTASANSAGLVKLGDQFSVDENGNLVITQVKLSSLVNDDGTEIVLG